MQHILIAIVSLLRLCLQKQISFGKKSSKILKRPVNIICVKTGDKYASHDVARLYRMVERNCALPFCFYCLTDDVYDLPDNVVGVKLDSKLDLESYWWKICMFDLDWDQPTLYFDLDIVIQKNFDHFFNEIQPDKILTIRPDDAGINRAYESLVRHEAAINTSIVGFIPKNHSNIFYKFIKNVDYNILEYRGLDRFLSKDLTNFNFISYQDYYYRWKDDKTPSSLCTSKTIDGKQYMLAHDQSKTICLISQAEPEMYQGLEEYFL